MFRLLFSCLFVAVGVNVVKAESPEPRLALKGLDPVALVDGKELPGQAAWEASRGLFRYRFATEQNKAAFEAKPEQYAVQWGGACGRMGPFSGTGHPDRFYVHDRKIYLFASEGCRNAFKAAPALYLEQPNEAPTGTAEQQRAGKLLLEKVLTGFGGADKVDALKSLSIDTKVTYKQQNADDYIGHHKVSWMFPDRYRFEEVYSKAYGQAVAGRSGFQFAGKENWPLEENLRTIAWRQALRDPLGMLRNRHAPGFVALATGTDKIQDQAVEILTVALNGATTTWYIDSATGRIIQISYLALRGIVGENVIQFSDFKSVDGIILPHSRKVIFNGKEIKSPQLSLEKIEVGAAREELFSLPR